MRWLIEFVGVAWDSKKKQPRRPHEFDEATDVSIQSFASADATLELHIDYTNQASVAWTLARVWKGCSQSCVHPTDCTGPPAAEPRQLADAFNIIVDHLQNQLYNLRTERRLSEIVLQKC